MEIWLRFTLDITAVDRIYATYTYEELNEMDQMDIFYRYRTLITRQAKEMQMQCNAKG